MEYEITVKVQTNSSNRTDIGTAVVSALLHTSVIVSVLDINIQTIEEKRA